MKFLIAFCYWFSGWNAILAVWNFDSGSPIWGTIAGIQAIIWGIAPTLFGWRKEA